MGNAAKIIAVLVLIAAILFGINRYNESQKEAGRAECRAAVATATVKAVEEALIKEREGIAHQTIIVTKLNKDLKDELSKKDIAIAKLHSGTLVLRDPGNTNSCQGSTVTSSSSGDIETSGGKLSTELSEFLISEASRADQVVVQLQACQAVLVNDRNTINGRNP